MATTKKSSETVIFPWPGVVLVVGWDGRVLVGFYNRDGKCLQRGTD